MLMRSAFVYALTLTLGIGSVMHAKNLLIEQRLQEAAQTEELAFRAGLPMRRHRMRPKFSYAPHHWSRWTV